MLGCLIEQEAGGARRCPLSLNTVRLASNQTSGRDPVVAYDDRTVEDTLLSLKSRGLARFVPPSPEARTTRYRHRADERWRMGSAELAVLAVLLLGGVQAVSEVRARAQRLHPLITPVEVEAVLDTLAARTPRPFAARVAGASAGETGWAEVLTGPAPDGADDGGAWPAPSGSAGGAGDLLPAEVANQGYAALVARAPWISSSGSRTRCGPASRRGRLVPGAVPPPPPPPVEVTPPARQLGRGAGERRQAAGGPPGRARPRTRRRRRGAEQRVTDIERRLAASRPSWAPCAETERIGRLRPAARSRSSPRGRGRHRRERRSCLRG